MYRGNLGETSRACARSRHGTVYSRRTFQFQSFIIETNHFVSSAMCFPALRALAKRTSRAVFLQRFLPFCVTYLNLEGYESSDARFHGTVQTKPSGSSFHFSKDRFFKILRKISMRRISASILAIVSIFHLIFIEEQR